MGNGDSGINCGIDGCVTLQSFVKAIDKLEKATDKLTDTVTETNGSLNEQKIRLEYGTEKFQEIDEWRKDIDHEIYGTEDFKGIKTRLSVVENNMPSKTLTTVVGGASAGAGIVLWEFIKSMMKAKTG